MRTISIGSLALAASVLAPTTLAAQGLAIPADARVVYVSGSRVSAESAPGKAGAARIQAVQQARTAELRTRQQAIEATRKQLAAATTADERSRLSAQESAQRFEFERLGAQAQVELQNLQREVGNELRPKLSAVLAELLKGTKVEAVLNLEAAVFWSTPALDITNVVIERLNAAAATAPTVSPATPPAGPAPAIPATPTPPAAPARP
jgi:Skp family chaperone for outer membrane proteins